MKNPAYVQTLRPDFARAYYESCNVANRLSLGNADLIACKHGLPLARMSADLERANAYGARQIPLAGGFPGASDADRVILDREHGGRFHSARFLFEGYCHESARVSYCESAEARRNEDRAYGSD